MKSINTSGMSILANMAYAYSSNATVNQLREHMIYLNNLLPDEQFIDIFADLSSYFANFPSDTEDKALLSEYVSLVEVFFIAKNVEFDILANKLNFEFV